ncbi:hypothetical protein GCM10025871_01900 [Deinococcus metallilatus]|nr:hypothetical protein GCM10025871_01900 [Deinococcus metallilatus]
MKKSISNRDVERIAKHAGLSSEQVRAALAMRGDVYPEVQDRVTASASELRYTITVRDRVAMAAGTSVATVNRAYRPDARHLVRPEVLQAIEREAARMGYTPDPVAQARRTQQSTIVAICPEMTHLSSPYHTALIRALTEVVTERGLYPVITPIPQDRLLPDIAQSSITSLVVLWEDPRTEQQAAALRAAGRQAVLIGHHGRLPSVAPDWTDAYERLTHRALEQAYDVLHLGYFSEHRWAASARLEGVARALASSRHQPRLRLWLHPELDLPCAVETLHAQGMFAAAGLLEALAQTPGALERRPRLGLDGIIQELMSELRTLQKSGRQRVALLGYSDMTVRQLMWHLTADDSGVRLGDQLGLAGHDNLEPIMRYLNPVLTTVAYDFGDFARQLIDQMGPEKEGGFTGLPTELILRESL